jgi:hypothetical protein
MKLMNLKYDNNFAMLNLFFNLIIFWQYSCNELDQ